jgi:hypothetical protein
MGDFINARKLHEKVVGKRMKFLGEDHPKTILSTHRLALILIEIPGSSATILASIRRVTVTKCSLMDKPGL